MPDLSLVATHAVPVTGAHMLHVQEFGDPRGRPALVVHGGPGSSQTPLLRAGFDAADGWRVVCIDQRGCGASRPRGAVRANTTDDLIEDIERVRERLHIERWLLVGGSWGASLALAYAAAHADAVAGLLLRGSFVARRRDVAAFFDAGPFAGSMDDVLPMLRDAMLGDDTARAEATARAWWRWERDRLAPGTSPTLPPASAPTASDDSSGDLSADALAAIVDRYRVQSHYLAHDCWLARPDLPQRCAALPFVPVCMLHGTADRVCPIDAARELARRIPQARWFELPGVGHDPSHPVMSAALRAALAAYARDAHFDAVALAQPNVPAP